MDERDLSEAIGRSVGEATARMMPQMTEMMRATVLTARTGLYVEVAADEMARRLSERAVRLRARAEEVAAEPSTERLPPHMRARFEFELTTGRPSVDDADDAAYKTVLAQIEQRMTAERQRRRARIEALRTEAERLDFIASHMPKDQVVRLDQRELDDLLFRDLDAANACTY